MKRSISVLLAVVIAITVLPLNVFAVTVIASGTCGANGDNLTWVLTDDGTLTISGEGKMDNYNAGSYAGGNPPWYQMFSLSTLMQDKIKTIIISEGVTSIGEEAFVGCSILTSVNISDSVTNIGKEAFSYCRNLTSINIPDSVITIGDEAFYECTSLTSVTIGNSVTSIGNYAFSECTSLKSIYVSEANEYYSDLDGVLFDKTLTTLIKYPENKANTSYVIPTGVTSICERAFMKCSNLISVTIPDSVTDMGSWIFYECKNLTNVSIPNSVTYIGDFAFYGCSSLTSITIPNSVTSIGNWAFSSCWNLTSIVIPDSVISTGGCAFLCSSLTSITFLCPTTSIYSSSQSISSNATIYGYAGSTAQAYAEKYGRKFVELYTTDVKFDIPAGSIGIYVVDEQDMPVDGATVTATSKWNTETQATDENGLALLDAVFNDEVQLTVTKDEYQTVTVDRIVRSGDVAIVTINIDDGKPHIFAVDATLGDEKYDLMHEKHYFKSNSECIEKADDSSNVTEMVITVESSASEQIDCYQLIQGGQIVAQSNIASFCIPVYTGTPDDPDKYINDCRIDTFSAGKNVYIRTVDVNGEVSAMKKLGLVISQPHKYTDNSGGKLEFGKKLKFEVPSDIPFFGGDELELGWDGLPFDFEVFSDGTVKFAVNMREKKDETGFIDGAEVLDWDDVEDVYMNALYGKTISVSSPQKFEAGKVTLDANIMGYGEGYVDDYGNIVVNVGLVVSVYQEASYTWTSFVGYVPVYFSVGEKIGFTGSGEFSIINSNGNWEFTGAVGELNPKASLNIDGGVGANGILNVGASGRGTLSWLHRMSDNYENVTLTAEFKIVATAFLFNYEKHLWDRTLTLYDSYGTSISAETDLLYSGLYTEELYDTISRDYLYTAPTSAISDGVVKNNVYPYTTPELVKVGNAAYLFWLDDITERTPNNRTALVYSISYDDCITWSEPIQVIPKEIDGAATFDYDIYVEGTNIHIAFCRANQVFDDEEIDINEMAASSEIYYVTLSTLDNSVTAPVRITNNEYADTMPSVVSQNGKVLVAYAENRLEDGLFGTSNTYMVCSSVVGSEVNTSLPVSGLITELSAGIIDDEIYVSYVVDTDLNYSTDNDTELWITSSQQTLLLDKIGSNVYSPTFAKVGNNHSLLWHSDGNIYYTTSLTGNVSQVFCGATPITLGKSFRVINGADGETRIVWNSTDPDSDAGNICIYESAYVDNSWTDSYEITEIDSELTSTICGYCADGIDYIAYINSYNMSEVITANLCVNTVLPRTDVAIIDVNYEYNDVHPGELLQMSVTVKNCGSTNISDFLVVLNDTTVCQIAEAALTVGETKTFDVTGFAVPEALNETTSFDVVVTALNDSVSDNNSVDVVIGYTDLHINTERKLINGQEWVSVSVSNLSEISSDAYLTVSADSENGSILYNEKLEDVEKGASQFVMINLDALKKIENTDVFYVSVSSQNEDIQQYNNSQMLYLGLDREVYTIGDLTSDDIINYDDAFYILYHSIFGEAEYPINQNCDFTGDGTVDRNDAIYLLYHIIFGAQIYPLS